MKGKKGVGKAKVGDWQRFWCVLDGSTLLCYLDEEVRERTSCCHSNHVYSVMYGELSWNSD